MMYADFMDGLEIGERLLIQLVFLTYCYMETVCTKVCDPKAPNWGNLGRELADWPNSA